MKTLQAAADLRYRPERFRTDGGPAEVQGHQRGLLLRQQPPQVPQRQEGGGIFHAPRRAPSVRVELKGNVAAGQREAAEVRGATGEPVEREVREVAQVRKVQLFQAGQGRLHLEVEQADRDLTSSQTICSIRWPLEMQTVSAHTTNPRIIFFPH